MNKKSYLKNIIKEEYKKLTTQSIESIIKEEYQKIIQEQSTEELDAKFKGSGRSDALKVLKRIKAKADKNSYYFTLADKFVRDFNVAANAPRSADIEIARSSIISIYPNGTAYADNARFGAAAENEFDYDVETHDGKETFVFTDRYGDLGKLVQKGNSLFIDPLVGQTDQEAEETSLKAYIQTAGDWLGLIPVFGDVIDIGNMLWYANDRKWFDAVLSGIAIIPVVGSVFKIGVKNAFKVARLNLNLANKVGKRILSGTPGAAAEFWKLALTNQTFTKEQYELLSTGAKRIADGLAKAEKTANQYPLINNQANKQYLYNIRKFLQETEKILSPSQIAKLTKGGKIIKPFSKAFATAADAAAIAKSAYGQGPRLIYKMLSAISRPARLLAKYTGLGKLFRISPKNIDELAAGYQAFVRQRVQQNPEFLASIARAMPLNKIEEIFGSMKFFNQTISPKQWQLATFWSQPEIIQRLNKSGKMDTFFKAAESGNPVYDMFFHNRVWQSEQYFKRASDFSALLQTGQIKRALGAILKEYTDLKKLLISRKSLDRWYNEIQDGLGATGLSDDRFGNNPDALLLPIAFGMADIFSSQPLGTTRMSMSQQDSPFVRFAKGLTMYLPYLGDKLINQMKLYDPDNPDSFTDNFIFDAGRIPGITVGQKMDAIDKSFSKMGLTDDPDYEPIIQAMKKQVMTWGESDRNPERQIQQGMRDRL